jgi:hypothetical protein
MGLFNLFSRPKPKDNDNVLKNRIISLLKKFFTQKSYQDNDLYYFLQNELSTKRDQEETKVFNELIEFVIETITYKRTDEDKYKKALNILKNDFVIKIKQNAQYYIVPIIKNIREMQIRHDENWRIDIENYSALCTNMNHFVNDNKEYNNLNLYLVFIHLQIIERIRINMKDMKEINDIHNMIYDYLNKFCEKEIQPDLNVLNNFIDYCIEDIINYTKSKGGKRKSRRKSRKNRRKTNRRRRSRR